MTFTMLMVTLKEGLVMAVFDPAEIPPYNCIFS
jgi:hypothetical protein